MAKGIYVGVANSSLVANGDFENGISGWTTTPASTASYTTLTQVDNGYSGKCAKFEIVQVYTSAVVGNTFAHTVSTIAGHKYYGYGYIKGQSNNVITMGGLNTGVDISLEEAGVGYVYGNYVNGNATDWTKSSFYHTATATTSNSQFRSYMRIGNKPDGTGDLVTVGMAMYYDNMRLYDLTTMYGTGNEPTMEWCDSNETALENLYKQQNSKARKVKKVYIGVDGKARKIKKGYIGVGGVARLFFSSEKELSYYGTAANLSVARSNLAATSVGNYAIFGGGEYPDGATNAVNCYSTQLTVNNSVTVNFTKCDLAATTVGNYALFAGGTNRTTSGVRREVVSIDSLLTRKNITDLSEARFALAATTVGDYALFGGGRGRSTSYVYDTVDSYTSELVQGTPTVLSSERYNLAATTVGDYALFAGGMKSSYYATVDTYTSTLAKGTATDLSEAKGSLAATTVGDYALFAGGQYTSTGKATVDSYTSALVKGTPAALSVQRTTLTATTVGGYALFGGGRTSTTGTYKATVDTYNESLVKSTTTDLSVAREMLAATTVGDYALFAGGSDSNGYSATVDVYQAI